MSCSVVDTLRSLNGCGDAILWARTAPSQPYRAWRACERGDWLLWIAARVGVDRREVVYAACQVARTALRHVPEGETRPLRAIETTEAWTRGEATIAQVRAARAAAYAAAYGAAAPAAAAAAAAADAADAADAAFANAAAYTANAAVRASSLRESATIVRAHIWWSAVRDALAARGQEAANVRP